VSQQTTSDSPRTWDRTLDLHLVDGQNVTELITMRDDLVNITIPGTGFVSLDYKRV